MLKHISKLFDYHDLANAFNEYERTQANGDLEKAAAMRAEVSRLVSRVSR